MRTVTAKLLFEIPNTPWMREERQWIGVDQDAHGMPFCRLSERLDTASTGAGVWRSWEINGPQRRTLGPPEVDGLPVHILPLIDGTLAMVLPDPHDPVRSEVRIYSPTGERLSTFDIGKGAQDVQAAPDGSLWVSYFDEGISGPPGESGLACFNASGQLMFAYNDAQNIHSLPPIRDCYALNVCSRHEVWLCYYNSWTIARLIDRRVVGLWRSPIHYCSAFAVYGYRTLFIRDHSTPVSLHLVNLITGATEQLIAVGADGEPVILTYVASDSSGQPQVFIQAGIRKEIRRPFPQPSGRGSRLYLRSEKALYLIDLGEIA